LRRATIRPGQVRGLLAGVALAGALTACSVDKLLKANDPNTVSPGAVSGKDNLSAQLASLIGDFQVAFSGDGNGDEGLVNMGGLFTDEFSFSETFPTRVVVDRRNINEVNSTMSNIYFNAQRARASAERVSDQFNQFDPGGEGHSEALSLGGYSMIMLAESYCSGVPFSGFKSDGSLDPGPSLTTAQVLQATVAKFDSALALGLSASDTNLAELGKARALLDLGTSNAGDAAALVASVPLGYRYIIFHSTNSPRQYNGMWELIWNEGRWTQADNEGGNGLPFVSANDPRTPSEDIGTGFDGSTEVFAPLQYSARDSNTVLTSGIEARLIEAEAQLSGAAPGDWLATLNALRATVPGLAPLSDPGNADARLDLLFSERAFWLYATGHRLGDMRRLSRSIADGGYGRNPETVYPTGAYFRGGTFGAQTEFPIPIEEKNNPNFTGCDPTVP
jgi:hypothetical protein